VVRRFRSPVGEIHCAAAQRTGVREMKVRSTLDGAAESLLPRQQRRIVDTAGGQIPAHPEDSESRCA
jgi:Holliday junction resolvase-like predicted endonuclease